MDAFYYRMAQLKCLKAVLQWRHVLLTIYDVIIQKTMSSRQSEEDVMIKFCKY